jgi:hypothetical protein
MSDSIVYDLSSTSETIDRPFINKDWQYVNDQNNGSYASGQVIISTETLSNSGKWVNFQEAYLKVPVIAVVSSKTGGVAQDMTAAGTEFVAGLKNGHWNLIHSMVVEYNNTAVVQSTAFTNVYSSFKAHTTYSLDDVKTVGPSIGYSPDSETSWAFGNATCFGSGSCNNSNFVNNHNSRLTYGANSLNSGNRGFLERQLNDQPTLGQNGSQLLTDTNKMTDTLQNRIWKDTNYVAIYITATIRLKDIANLFEKFPVVRGATFKFTINVNQSSFKVTKSRGTTAAQLFGANLTDATGPRMVITEMQSLNGTNPLMIASSFGSGADATSAGAIFNSNDANGSVISASCYVGAVTSQEHSALNLRSTFPVRLYAPLYTMNPLRLEEYLNMGQKLIQYTDIFSYNLNNVATGGFNQTISNGMSGIKKVIVCPFVASAANGGYTPAMSPFASEPSTTSPFPGGALSELNLKIAGMNVLQNNIKYGYEAFLHQMYGINSINGGVTSGINSGLISQRMWQNNYQYYVFDCSRHLPEEDRVSKAVEIYGKNNSIVALDLFVFIEVQREIKIDIATGARVA